MPFSDDFETGWPAGYERTPWCIRRTGASRTLCNRLVSREGARGWFASPEGLGPSDVGTAHAACLDEWQAIVRGTA